MKSEFISKFLGQRWLSTIVSIAIGLIVWQVLSRGLNPMFLPSPWTTWLSAIELWNDGTLVRSIVASGERILIGWGLGLMVGIPLGILMGNVMWIRRLLDPYIEFFRFIPPVAFVSLAIIWMGPGELSKISLIFYTTVFIVILNMIAGVLSINELRLRAAAALGAGRVWIMLTVILPSTVPFMVTGARLAMGNSFLTIVSAEMIASQDGLGALIWTARNFARTEWVFVGIIALGLLGYVFDRIVRLVSNSLLKRYGVAI
jgi:taurine transport system permease protein